MTWRVVTAPGTEPVSLSEAKAHLRLEETADDAYVTALIVAARTHVEKVCARGLVLQTVELVKPGFLAEGLALEGGHLAETPIVVVKYLDEDEVEQTLAADDYYYVTGGEHAPARLYLKPTGAFTLAKRADAVRVQYRVGWADAGAVPASLKHAVMLAISQMYEHRTPEVTAAVVSSLSFSFDALINPFVLWGV